MATLSHVRLLVDDFVGCFRFYRDVLGLETKFPEDPPYAEFALGGGKFLALFDRTLQAAAMGENPDGARGTDTVALIFEVDDPDAEHERLRALGVPIVAEPADRTEWGLRTVHVRDPDGNLVELFSEMTQGE